MLHLLIFKARQEAFKCGGCFCWIKRSGCILFFLFAFIVRSWSYVFCLNQDTAGSERYEAMSRIYYRGARAAIVCFGEIWINVNLDFTVYSSGMKGLLFLLFYGELISEQDKVSIVENDILE